MNRRALALLSLVVVTGCTPLLALRSNGGGEDGYPTTTKHTYPTTTHRPHPTTTKPEVTTSTHAPTTTLRPTTTTKPTTTSSTSVVTTTTTSPPPSTSTSTTAPSTSTTSSSLPASSSSTTMPTPGQFGIQVAGVCPPTGEGPSISITFGNRPDLNGQTGTLSFSTGAPSVPLVFQSNTTVLVPWPAGDGDIPLLTYTLGTEVETDGPVGFPEGCEAGTTTTSSSTSTTTAPSTTTSTTSPTSTSTTTSTTTSDDDEQHDDHAPGDVYVRSGHHGVSGRGPDHRHQLPEHVPRTCGPHRPADNV